MGKAIESNAIIGFGFQKHNTLYNSNSFHKKPPTTKDKKKWGPLNFIKVALCMLRKNDDKTSKKMSSSFQAPTNATLNQFVGACRPLHYQSGIGGMSPPPPPLDLPEGKVVETMVSPNERYGTTTLYRRNYAASSSSSSCGDMSSYASALSLYDLDNHDDDEEEEDEDAYYDGIEGDEMIDTKADMFIASFYQQMRLEDKH